MYGLIIKKYNEAPNNLERFYGDYNTQLGNDNIGISYCMYCRIVKKIHYENY